MIHSKIRKPAGVVETNVGVHASGKGTTIEVMVHPPYNTLLVLLT